MNLDIDLSKIYPRVVVKPSGIIIYSFSLFPDDSDFYPEATHTTGEAVSKIDNKIQIDNILSDFIDLLFIVSFL